MKNKKQGISLIVLVIVIIVMIILATAIILALTGNNIIGNASKAKKDFNSATEIERLTYLMAEEKLNGNTKTKEYIVMNETGNVYELNYETDEIKLLGNSNDGEDYDITTGLTGSGTETSPYEIYCIEDLVKLQRLVDMSNYNNKYVKLMNDLDFQDPKSYKNAFAIYKGSEETTDDDWDINENGITEPLLIELTTGKGFSPIGYYISSSNKTYSLAKFDGNNKKIRNLYINRPDETYVALIGPSYGITINNLRIENVDITGGTAVGAILGASSLRGGTVDHCSVSGQVKGGKKVGGIIGIGSRLTISNSFNEANVTGTESSTPSAWHDVGEFSCIGGIAGTSAKCINCYNTGTIKGDEGVGGLSRKWFSSNLLL